VSTTETVGIPGHNRKETVERKPLQSIADCLSRNKAAQSCSNLVISLKF